MPIGLNTILNHHPMPRYDILQQLGMTAVMSSLPEANTTLGKQVGDCFTPTGASTDVVSSN